VTGLERSTWPEVADAAASGAVLLIPVGSTEQHGPHLPLTTDTDIATAIATAAARRHPDLVVAPALAYGSSGEHQDFAGTLSIGREVTERVLVELGRSASRDFAHTIVVSTHGGNAHPVERATARLLDEDHPVTAWWPDWSGDLHAGRTETSVMLAIAPERVHHVRVAGDRRPAAVIWPELFAHGVRAVSANGVLGDPAGASAAEGRALLSRAVDSLLDRIGRARADLVGGAG
jgi:creatinine amidohydrolase